MHIEGNMNNNNNMMNNEMGGQGLEPQSQNSPAMDVLTSLHLNDEFGDQRHSAMEQSQMNLYMQVAELQQKVNYIMEQMGGGNSAQMGVNPQQQNAQQPAPNLTDLLNNLLQSGGQQGSQQGGIQ